MGAPGRAGWGQEGLAGKGRGSHGKIHREKGRVVPAEGAAEAEGQRFPIAKRGGQEV